MWPFLGGRLSHTCFLWCFLHLPWKHMVLATVAERILDYMHHGSGLVWQSHYKVPLHILWEWPITNYRVHQLWSSKGCWMLTKASFWEEGLDSVLCEALPACSSEARKPLFRRGPAWAIPGAQHFIGLDHSALLGYLVQIFRGLMNDLGQQQFCTPHSFLMRKGGAWHIVESNTGDWSH